VSPELFIPILEETGLIEAVGAWVLKTALTDFLYWKQCGAPIERVAVNIAARQLFAGGFAESVEACLRAVGLKSDCLELELTETTLVKDFQASNAVLAALVTKGIQIAVDDFGTGYSSLGYLKDLVFDTLKIDRAFVINLPEDKAVAIVKAIIAVANALGKKVVAEGVETELQRAQLAKLGCDFAQGFLFSRPVEREELLKCIREAQRQPEPRSGAARA
jgi:EAL domain-containing protein (putative c-di-GMP-specific phosphodiesterase class I)